MTIQRNISALSPIAINFSNAGTKVFLTTNSNYSTFVNVTIMNASALKLPGLSGYVIIKTFDISILSKAAIATNITTTYPCSQNSSLIYPFVLRNGTWSMISNFTTNGTSCTIRFQVPKDPIIGIFKKIVAYANTSTTSSVTTTINNAKVPGVKASRSGSATNLALIILAIVLLFTALAIVRRHHRKHKMKHHA
ncbi:MAG: hypothetical protein ACP5K5_03320 [Candidatus Micrarchaeia archaeon]